MEGKVCNISGNKTLAVNRSLTKDEAIVITTALDKIISDYSRFKETKEEVRQLKNLKEYIRWDDTEDDFAELVSSVKMGTFYYKKYLKGGKWRKFNIAVSESDKGYTVFSPYGESFVYGIYKDKETGRVAIETRYQEGENRKPFNVE